MLRYTPANDSSVVSPISVIFALAMVQAGSKGTTRSQINSVISKGASDNEVEEYYSKLFHQIMKPENGVKSRIANGFFLNKQFKVENDYEQTIKKWYEAKVEALDFGRAKEAAKVIDDFIANTTEGKIRDMVNENSVQGAFSLIVNAIYFTAEWKSKFNKNANSNGTFYSSARNKREVEYMNAFRTHRLYAEDNDLQVLSLQYLDTSYALNIFLPKSRFGLNEVRSRLTGERIQSLFSQLKDTYISITIPKMKIETGFKLKEALIGMGVTEMFSDNANLTGITKEPPLKVSNAAHRAIIEVDEDGTTAAAATVLTMRATSAFIREEPVKFQANHPFMFVLTKDNNPLFMGQFV
nr:Protease inhibitor I4 domain containing protein [Haemonchus contortus]